MRSLTGLRFFAAMMVVLLHAAQRFDPIHGLTSVVGFGYAGVSFFFMLSGFILAWTSRDADTARQFYWRRFARVWPLHALTTGMAIVVALLVGLPLLWPALTAILTLVQAWFPGPDIKYAFNGPSWSLSCELFFYLLFPWLIKVLMRRQRILSTAIAVGAVMVAVAGACAMLFQPEHLGFLLYTMPAFRLGEFVIGILLAIALQRGWRPRISMMQAVLGTLIMYGMLALAANLVLHDVARLPYFVADLWMMPGCAAIIAAGAAGDLRGDRGIIRSAPVVRLGQWSFALYLVHELILKASEPLVDDLDSTSATVVAVVVIVLSVVASGGLYVWFERPMERRLRAWVAPKQEVTA
ncbi:acyltransferase family protein [Paenarthrobacter nitroguajacolicus]|uniref:acyltransferase family protein n=1 Tax=Paenarthrobacter nitroguajacolicus TaxID=211146 RepID=UPI0015B8635E|nr:acyltransferase [Paenarthrobacter nitroguajacolicus]